MATVDTLAAKFPKYKSMSKMKKIATTMGEENMKITYYGLLKIANTLNELRQQHPQDSDIPVVMKNLIGILKNMKQKTNASQDMDKEEIESFVFMKFTQADNELRSGQASPMTIKKLLDAAHLIELLTVFGAIGSESGKRKKWAKVQAVKMNKNLKAGKNIYDGLGLNIAGKAPGQQAPPPSQSSGNQNPFGGQGQPQSQPQQQRQPSQYRNKPSYQQPPPQQNYQNGGGMNGYSNTPNRTLTQSVLDTPENDLLTKLSQLHPRNLGMDLNSNFSVQITKSNLNTRNGPQSNNQIAGSFMQSGLYRQNVTSFYQEADKIQGYLKKANSTVNGNLGDTYTNLLRCKNLMNSLLSNS